MSLAAQIFPAQPSKSIKKRYDYREGRGGRAPLATVILYTDGTADYADARGLTKRGCEASWAFAEAAALKSRRG